MQIKENISKSGEFVALSEKVCLEMFLKSATDVDDFIVCGRLFHACGPAKAKARLPNSDRGFGTTRFPADEEHSRFLAATEVTGIHSSARYDGARLCRVLYTMRNSLNSMRCGTWSQLRSCRTSDMWSYFLRRETTLAAAFMTC